MAILECKRAAAAPRRVSRADCVFECNTHRFKPAPCRGCPPRGRPRSSMEQPPAHPQEQPPERRPPQPTPLHAGHTNVARPPTDEHFRLKDLDTGMQSYVTDQEWVEQPIAPTFPMTAPTNRTTRDAASTNTTSTACASAPPPRPPTQRAVKHVPRPETANRTLHPVDHLKIMAHKTRERDREFTNLYRWQRVHAHRGAIRALEFSSSGGWLATAGADAIVKIWPIDATLRGGGTDSRAANDPPANAYTYIRHDDAISFCGHTSDVTDLSWSKNDFLLSASVDRSIRLWHPRAKTCLRILLHTDIVTSVSFHPTDEQICIAGSADGKLTMWHMKKRDFLSRADTDDMITATAITPDGTTALVGTQHGRCKIFALFDEIQAEWQFKHMTQIDVRSKKARYASGKKVCGFCFHGKGDKVLVSSNDGRLRLYRLDDKSVVCKFSGAQNSEARFNGSFDPSGRYMLCASETRTIHIWDIAAPTCTEAAHETRARRASDDDDDDTAASAKRKDIGIAYESFVVQKSGQITAAAFAPHVVEQDAMFLRAPISNARTAGVVIVSASDDGDLRVFGCC